MSIIRVPPKPVCMRTILASSSFERSVPFVRALLSKPVVNIQSLDALEMSLVVGCQVTSLEDSGRGDQDVGVADQRTPPVEVSVGLRCLHNDGVGEGQDVIGGAETFERRLLPGCSFGFETAQYLVARDDREREALVDTEIVSRPVGYDGIAPQDGR